MRFIGNSKADRSPHRVRRIEAVAQGGPAHVAPGRGDVFGRAAQLVEACGAPCRIAFLHQFLVGDRLRLDVFHRGVTSLARLKIEQCLVGLAVKHARELESTKAADGVTKKERAFLLAHVACFQNGQLLAVTTLSAGSLPEWGRRIPAVEAIANTAKCPACLPPTASGYAWDRRDWAMCRQDRFQCVPEWC
jgi:hypothetical protein